MSLYTWSWLFLLAYVAVMTGFGVMGSRRVAGADDFATARGALRCGSRAGSLPEIRVLSRALRPLGAGME